MDTRINTNGNITWYWYAANAFVNPDAATVTELNAGLNITNALSYNDTDFGVQASNTLDDPSFAAKGVTLTRGAGQYGGTISSYYPGEYDDAQNSLSNTYDALEQRVIGYIVIRNDGEHGWLDPWVAGDLYSYFKVVIAGEAQAITGEEAFRYSVTALSQGDFSTYNVVVGAIAPTVVVTGTIGAAGVGDKGVLTAKVNDRAYTRGVDWVSSDSSVVSVSRNGVWTAHAAGTATVTAVYGPTGTASATITATIT